MKWKRFYLDNLGTKLMALVLALLLWIYLYNESTDSDEFHVVLDPAIEKVESLARFELFASDGQPLGNRIRVKVTGPKGALGALPKEAIRCKPFFSGTLFKEPQGSISRELSLSDLNLPPGFRVVFLPSPQVTIQYVRFVTVKVPVVLRDPKFEGTCIPGFRVESVLVDPTEVEIRFPADRKILEAPLKRISVQHRADSFEQPGVLDLPEEWSTMRTSVTVKVKIQRHGGTKERFTNVPLVLVHSNPKLLSRLELVDKTITVEVEGSDLAVQAIKSTHTTDLFAFVMVDLSADDIAKGGKYPQSRIHCHVLNDQIGGQLTVTVMPDIQPENRTVNVKVLPE